MVFIILILILIGLVFILWHCKPISKDSVLLFTGDPGTGKTSSGVSTAINNHRINMLGYYIKTKVLHKQNVEKPYIYCNMPLANIEYKEFKLEHLRREMRFEYGSTIFLNEMSLIADSMLAYNVGRDEARKIAIKQIQLFCKLIRHELLSKRICLIIDTQNPNDLCVACDRVLSTMHYLTGAIKWLPFIRIVKYKKVSINMDGITNTYEGDINDNCSWFIVPKSVFKKYNSYCYEFLTRDKPLSDKVLYYNAKRKKDIKRFRSLKFVIPTITDYKEIKESNAKILNELERKEGEADER